MTIYSTSDLARAASLCHQKCKLIELSPSETGKYEFVFEQSEKLDETNRLFQAGQMRVEPVLFCTYLRYLKSKLYSQTR